MNLPLFKHHLSGKDDALLTVTVLSIALVAVRFFIDGMTFTLFGHTISVGVMNSASYATLLSPIAGAHGTREFCSRGQSIPADETPDDPDGGLA